jgi:hypothetical protein
MAMKAIGIIAPRVIRPTSYRAHHTEKRGPPELPAGQNRPEHGSIHALLSTRFRASQNQPLPRFVH